MNPEALGPWRDLSLVWFAVWLMVFAASAGVVLFLLLKSLRRLNQWLKTSFRKAQIWALRIQSGTHRVSHNLANAVIRIQAESARVSTTTRGVIDFLRGK